jgi:hypothetical protein
MAENTFYVPVRRYLDAFSMECIVIDPSTLVIKFKVMSPHINNGRKNSFSMFLYLELFQMFDVSLSPADGVTDSS